MLTYLPQYTLVVVLVLLSWNSAYGEYQLHYTQLGLMRVSSAYSAPPRLLTSIAHPSTLALEILPRKQPLHIYERNSFSLLSPDLRHDDTFRLILAAYDETFHLHLRPNDDLIHPAARVNYYHTPPGGKPEILRSEPLLRESVKAYWGEVIDAAYSPARLREDAAGVVPRLTGEAVLGWARIVVHHQGHSDAGIPPVFEGTFTVRGVTHNVMTRDNYLRHRLPGEPDLAPASVNPDAILVIWRDSNVTEEQDAEPRTCAYDSLPYNTDPLLNSALLKLSTNISRFDPFLGIFGPLQRRDDVAGGGSGET
jgi:hypothetical protein